MTTIFKSELTSATINEQVAFNLSSKYAVVSTNAVVEELQKRGFVKREVRGGTLNRNGGTKVHTVRLVFGELINVKGDLLRPEVVITNSFDGKSAFKVKAGIFRQVCTNGLTVLCEELKEIKLRHSGDASDLALQIIERMAESLPLMMEIVGKMREKTLTEAEAIAFAISAAKVRWNKSFTPEQAKVLLQAGRPEDTGLQLWEVFNVVQERVLSTAGLQVPGMRRVQILKNANRYEKVNSELFALAMNQLN